MKKTNSEILNEVKKIIIPKSTSETEKTVNENTENTSQSSQD